MNVRMTEHPTTVQGVEPWKHELAGRVESSYEHLVEGDVDLPDYVSRHLRRLAPDAGRYERYTPGSSPSLRAARRAVDSAILATHYYEADPPSGMNEHILVDDLVEVVALQPDVITDEAIMGIRACLGRGALLLSEDGARVLSQRH